MARILVINDDPTVLQLICELLHTGGHRPIPGGPSGRGIELLPAVKPDLVIVDILDPPVGGLEVVRLARVFNPQLPVLVASGYNDLGHVLEAVLMGANYYQPLPFQIEEFFTAVQNTLDHPLMPPVEPLLEWAKTRTGFTSGWLLDLFLNIGRRSRGDWTLLHTAAVWGHTEHVELLLANGADVNARAVLGMTPLHWAARNGHKQTVELLLSKGANAAIKDAFGRSVAVCLDAG